MTVLQVSLIANQIMFGFPAEGYKLTRVRVAPMITIKATLYMNCGTSVSVKERLATVRD